MNTVVVVFPVNSGDDCSHAGGAEQNFRFIVQNSCKHGTDRDP
jgi:hypothetical protein